MTIYLGENGHVELQRQGALEADGDRIPIYTSMAPEDVNVLAKRFSFLGAQLGLITGDRIEIKTVSGQDLQLVDGHDFPDWLGYINIDAVGGIRLYREFNLAIDGKKEDAIDLVAPSEFQQLEVVSRDDKSRCIAQIRSFELATQRETIDVTTLNQQFRNQFHQGLVSGQGRMDCFWEHTRREDKGSCGNFDFSEYSAYIAFLCIRLQQGASFAGRFYLYDGGYDSPSVWYECQAVVTNVLVTVEPGEIISSAIDFITTGPIRLQTRVSPSYLKQEENEDYVLQESGDRIEITFDD